MLVIYYKQQILEYKYNSLEVLDSLLENFKIY